MAEIIFDDPYVMINTVDLSDHVRSVTINYKAEIQDKTAGGATSRERIAGLKDWSVDIEFNQDYASGEVDATLFDLVGAASFPIIIKPDGETTGVTNPKFTGNAVLETYSPIAGSVGDLATTTITMQGDGDMGRATSDA